MSLSTLQFTERLGYKKANAIQMLAMGCYSTLDSLRTRLEARSKAERWEIWIARISARLRWRESGQEICGRPLVIQRCRISPALYGRVNRLSARFTQMPAR